MVDEPATIGRTFGLSVLIGAFAGISLQMALTALRDPVDPSEWWAVPVLIIVYGFIAAPNVGPQTYALQVDVFGKRAMCPTGALNEYPIAVEKLTVKRRIAVR